ncbi:MAG: GtrA family protein [Lachnospiraceae bacterium]|nr:GtrA family protein [Lachnospiraceae bacterium]
MIKKLRKHFLNFDFMKFVIIGGINTLGSTFLAFLMMLFMQANLAYVLSYILSLAFAYLLNAWFVFKQKPEISKLFRFCLAYIPNFLINNGTFIIVYNIMGFHEYIALVISVCIGMPVTYLCVKFFAFKPHTH